MDVRELKVAAPLRIAREAHRPGMPVIAFVFQRDLAVTPVQIRPPRLRQTQIALFPNDDSLASHHPHAYIEQWFSYVFAP